MSIIEGRHNFKLPRNTLTKRQVQVLSLISQGLNYPEISKELGIAPITIRNHMWEIKYRLNANHRPHAVAIALRKGLI